jgi:hypothetical protein
MSKKSHSTRQPGKEPEFTILTIQQTIERRDRFRRAVNAQDAGELTLRQKQAVIEIILSGKPLPEIFYRPVTGDDGKVFYLVIRGWYHLQAIFEFTDNKFPTWTAEEKERFMRGEEE